MESFHPKPPRGSRNNMYCIYHHYITCKVSWASSPHLDTNLYSTSCTCLVMWSITSTCQRRACRCVGTFNYRFLLLSLYFIFRIGRCKGDPFQLQNQKQSLVSDISFLHRCPRGSLSICRVSRIYVSAGVKVIQLVAKLEQGRASQFVEFSTVLHFLIGRCKVNPILLQSQEQQIVSDISVLHRGTGGSLSN